MSLPELKPWPVSGASVPVHFMQFIFHKISNLQPWQPEQEFFMQKKSKFSRQKQTLGDRDSCYFWKLHINLSNFAIGIYLKKYKFFKFFDIDMRARCELMMNVIILKAKFLLKLCQMPWLPPTSDFQSYCNETFHPIWLFSTISQDLGILFSVSFSMFIPTMWCFLSWIAALLFIRSYHRVNKTARNLPLLNLLSLVWTTWDGLK